MRVLREFRRGGGQQTTNEARLKGHIPRLRPHFPRLAARLLKEAHSLRVFAKLDADFGQNPVGGRDDRIKPLLRRDVMGGNAARDIGHMQRVHRSARARAAPDLHCGPPTA